MNEQKSLLTRLGETLDQYRAERRGIAQERMPSGRAGWLHRLLPTPGNVIFTLVMIALLVAAQSVGAIPLRSMQYAVPASTGTIAYQGRLANAAGNPLTGTYPMIFRLYDVPIGGAPLWTEQWTGSNSVRVSDGLFNVMLGSLTPIQQSVLAGHDQLWLGITVGTDDEMQPRVQLGSVPFAVQALTVPDGSVTTAKIANGAVSSTKIADNAITQVKIQDGAVTGRAIADGTIGVADMSLDAWGATARSQGLLVMPEGSVTDNGAGTVSLGGTLIVMNPLSGTFIRVAAGTYQLGCWGYMYVDLPPGVPDYALVTPQVAEWRHSFHSFEGANRFLIAQRMSCGKVWFRFGWVTP